jgi:hypothetical protein
MDLNRRGFLAGVMASALLLPGCGSEDGPNERLGQLFEGFEELMPDGSRRPLQDFGADDYPVVYIASSREVFTGCSADVPAVTMGLRENNTDHDFVPVLVMPKPHSRDPDSKFLDKFREMQEEFPQARVLVHDDPNFVKRFSIRNGASYSLEADGYVSGHSRNVHVFKPDASQILFQDNFTGENNRMDPESFGMSIYTGRFDGQIASQCHVNSQLRKTYEFDCL